MSIVFATRNNHKIREFNEIIADGGLVALPLPADAPEVDETGLTFFDNAALKAISAFVYTGSPALADDSGLCVNALGGAPGVRSARFALDAGIVADRADHANNAHLLRSLAGVSDRSAFYVCSLALVVPSSWASRVATVGVTVTLDHPGLPAGAALVSAEGRVSGEIVDTAAGDGGFGYDPYFWLPDHGATMATLSSAQKHAISHRGLAMRTLAAWLRAPKLSPTH